MQTSNRNALIAGGVAVVAIVLIVLFLLLRGGGTSTGGLTGTLWQLSSIRQTTPAYQGVVPAADQPRYAITFNTDGSYNGTADCNQIAGTYTTSGSDGITIHPGISTLAMCPDDSFGPLFAHALTTATTWAVADGHLTLSRADGASMTFATGVPAASPAVAPSTSASASAEASPSAVPSASPSPSPTPSPSPSASPTATPAPTGTPVSSASAAPTSAPTATPASTPTATPTPTPAPSAPPASGLTGVNWLLTAITIKEPEFSGQVPPGSQANYTITFKTDGTFSAKADCNTLQGGYVAGSDGKLALTLGASTIVQCPEGSLSDLYIVALDKTASYAIAGSQLTITLQDQGTLVYKSATP